MHRLRSCIKISSCAVAECSRGAFQDGAPVPWGSHIIHLADRVAVQISADEPVLTQVGDICATSIVERSGRVVFIPEQVDALLAIKDREYIWLDATSRELDNILKRTVQYSSREFSTQELVDFSKLICRLIDFRSEFTATHSSGVAAVAVELARVTGFSKNERRMVELSGYLHDLGKLAIPLEILEKKGRLTEEERFIMRSHAYHTYQTLEPFEVLRLVSHWGSLHQERLNGTGYPFGLSADDLPLGARILAVADVFTALTEDRPYRKGMNTADAMAVLQTMSDNGELDAGLIDKVFKNLDMLNAIRETAQREARKEYNAFQMELERELGDSSLSIS